MCGGREVQGKADAGPETRAGGREPRSMSSYQGQTQTGGLKTVTEPAPD